MGPFLLATFLSALLLFQVQPIIARYILPWYGGSPSLWTACMMFFQAALLVGYLYAHLLGTRIPERQQPVVHLVLLGASLLLLPIGPPEAWVPSVAASPGVEILLLLALSVGAPFVLVAASGPLLQRWYAGVYPDRSPFRLYALSNLGSLIGLLAYPFLVEPRASLSGQTFGWSLAYVVLAGLFVACGILFRRRGVGALGEDPAAAGAATVGDRILWVSLAACGSTVLLAITNQICQDVAVVPFLWILPLSLYLVTFIIAFERDAWYVRWFWWPTLAVALVLAVDLLYEDNTSYTSPLLYQVFVYGFALFAACMVCHGELARSRSAARELTTFYLYVALGGALGGVFVNLLAPVVFTGYWELHIALVATVVLAGVCFLRGGDRRIRKRWFAAAWSVSVVTLAVLLVIQVRDGRDESIHDSRGFFGVLSVDESDAGGPHHERRFYHGKIRHGRQLMIRPMQRRPTAYYGVDSGVGVAIRRHPKRRESGNNGLDIGVVGMGIGTLSAYGGPRDSIRYYEINPAVPEIAREYFTYLENTRAETSVVLGDARLSLQREFDTSGSNEFDVLVLDAFSGDSVPVHLLTEEAFALYEAQLADGGILAVHISNLYVDLVPVVRGAARQLGMQAVLVEDDAERWYEEANDWVLLTANRAFLDAEVVRARQAAWPEDSVEAVHWTDDFSNLFELIYWGE